MRELALKQDVSGKRIAVVGSGVSGRGLALLACKLGADVFVTDRASVDEDTKNLFRRMGIAWEEGGHTAKCYDADMMVVGSGIPPRAPVILESQRRGVPVRGELDFVAPWLKGRIIGITGSNGKSTTAALAGHMLDAMGLSVTVAGNIGKSLADSTLMEWDFIVAELSSFQLFWNNLLSCSVVIVTNLAPDHLDWHGTYDHYVRSKKRVISTMTEDGAAIIQDRDMQTLAKGFSEDIFLPFFWNERDGGEDADRAVIADAGDRAVYFMSGCSRERLFKFDSLPLLGRHNVENAAMAAAALRLSGVGDRMDELFSGFRGLRHRCEKVAEIDGILFVDDSKGTNVASACTALTSIEGKKAVILGGQGKGEDYAPLAETVAKEAVAAIVIGEERERIMTALKLAGFEGAMEAEGLEDGVPQAAKALEGSGTVLLSPACTSWDMYPDYGARGDHFKEIVLSMRKEP